MWVVWVVIYMICWLLLIYIRSWKWLMLILSYVVERINLLICRRGLSWFCVIIWIFLNEVGCICCGCRWLILILRFLDLSWVIVYIWMLIMWFGRLWLCWIMVNWCCESSCIMILIGYCCCYNVCKGCLMWC